MSIKRLVADVGGTNTRIGLFDETHGKLERVVGYRNRDFAGLEDIVAAWLEELPCAAPSRACIAVAAPPSGDEVRMVNIGWSFSRRALAQRFGLEQLLWINDFQANAYALPFLDGAGLEPLNVGNPGDHRTLATVGPGTGLGGATLHWIEGRPVVGDGEPGHAGLSPANELELEIFRLLLPEYGDIYAELLVSGAGLARLYDAIARINGAAPEPLDPSEVSRRALAREDTNCLQALETFCALLGSACGDFVLCNGAYGGLYIAGGIVPRMTEFVRASEFLPRMRSKGAMRPHLEAVPVNIITDSQPGLVGAAHAPLEGT